MTFRCRPLLSATVIGGLLTAGVIGVTSCSMGDSGTESSIDRSVGQPAVPKDSISEDPSEPQDISKSDPDPGAEADSRPAKLPSCEEILPIDTAANVIKAPNVQFYEQQDDAQTLLASDRFGPSARSALSQAEESITCTWFIPNSDGFIHFSVARLPDGVRDDFLSALRASDYTESNHGEFPLFSYDDGQRGLGVGLMRFAFVGPFVFHTQDPREAGPAEVIDGILAANQGADGFA